MFKSTGHAWFDDVSGWIDMSPKSTIADLMQFVLPAPHKPPPFSSCHRVYFLEQDDHIYPSNRMQVGWGTSINSQ